MTTQKSPRIVSIRTMEDLVNAIAEETFLQVPDDMDLKQQQDDWFTAGGDSTSSFVDYLKARGATEHPIEVFNIDYL